MAALGPGPALPDEPDAGTVPTVKRRATFPFDPASTGETRKLARAAIKGILGLEEEASIKLRDSSSLQEMEAAS